MENVTDTVFRQIVARCGKPDLFFTEFTSTDGICSEGFGRVKRHLEFTDIERPIIAQIWGSRPEKFFRTAQILVEMGFDGIDINMGCPERKIVSKGSCGGLIRNPSLAQEIIQATKEGAKSLPVSVKTRIGYAQIETEKWIGFLLEQDIAALTIHGRTVKEMSKVAANWEEIEKAVELRNQIKKDTMIIGNGDILTHEEGIEKCRKYKTDGVMIGRGIFHNLWIFNSIDPSTIPNTEKLQLLIDHISLFKEIWGDEKPFDIMKKFYKVYISDVANANTFRTQLMELRSSDETIAHIRSRI
jgi:tRNA-dihydrouridine synthase